MIKPEDNGTLESAGPWILHIKELSSDYVDTVEILFGLAAGYQFDV